MAKNIDNDKRELDNKEEDISMENTIVIAGMNKPIVKVSASDFTIDVSKKNSAVLVLSENEGNLILLERKARKTRINIFEDEDDLEEYLSGNMLRKVIGDEVTKKYKTSLEVNTKDYDDFCKEAPNQLEELITVSFENASLVSIDKLLKVILRIAKIYACEHIINKLQQMSTDEIVALVESDNPLETFIEITT